MFFEPRGLDRHPAAVVRPVVFEDDRRLAVDARGLDVHRLRAGRRADVLGRFWCVWRAVEERTRELVERRAVQRRSLRLGTRLRVGLGLGLRFECLAFDRLLRLDARARVVTERRRRNRDGRDQEHGREPERLPRASRDGDARERARQLRRYLVGRLRELIEDATDAGSKVGVDEQRVRFRRRFQFAI
ncbi:hypothetical protein DJ76_08170 [Halorubrum ezzemoulense]|uniref:Uncharacterized protein n=1 Tax=Halorubrum ezzemoulense TaxID=337243 RepID=A0A256JY53_HALEZ|nr:hypothetical protein DJ76_08170 [Halorubrum ezzemoulense]